MKKLNIASVSRVVLAVLFMVSIIGPSHAFAASPAIVNLGSAGNFTILSKTGVSTTGSTSVVGDIGVSPVAASYVTGFGLTLPAGGTYSTSSLITGKVYASDYASPTPTTLTTAIGDMQTAYTDAMGRAADVTELSAGNIGGLTFAPGVYKWGTSVLIPTDITLSGNANDVWIFQIAQNLTVSSGAKVVLAGGAKASNVFWVVAGQTTLGTNSVFNGNILDQTAIVLNTGATLNGRALAQTAVTLDSNSVTAPSSSTSTTTTTNTNTNSSSSNSNANNNNSNNNNTTVNPLTTNATVTMQSGCFGTAPFSITTGQPCLNYVVQSGCSGSTPFSITTGQPCSNYTVQHGCSGTTLFSITTGQRCMNYSTVTPNVSATTYNFGMANLVFGSRGEAVMQLQMFLNTKFNLRLEVDGILGSQTLAGVKQFQAANNLAVDGIVGPNTKAKMYLATQ
ncbi:MAG: ice-binding family protein [bacterium]|nr:ice-binding family protein [bacterium]